MSKRKPSRSPERDDVLFVPSEDMTAHNFGSRNDELNDRQLFCWAYQTETKVRFSKLEGRTSSAGIGGPTYSKTLNSDYLINVYPPVKRDQAAFASDPWERDRAAFARKSIESLREHVEPDGSLTPFEIIGYDRMDNCLPPITKDQGIFQPVPPNFLFFEICLEAYTGYRLCGTFHQDDPAVPRGAMMGGAVVAALTAWRDPYIIQLFESLGFDKLLKISASSKMYLSSKEELRDSLHEYFLSNNGHRIALLPFRTRVVDNDEKEVSPFHAGDVDIFLQASPLTQSLYKSFLQRGLSLDVISNIMSFCGGVGICHGDLDRFSSTVEEWLQLEEDDDGYLVYALARNGLSFMFAPLDVSEWDSSERPRPTQLIMLDPQADLVGAVMDFDLSITSCTYDGASVRITPRAALSLTRMIMTVTPFCLEERRNRKRLLKYYRRGFNVAVVDPNCRHWTQCENCDLSIERQYSDRFEELDSDILKNGGSPFTSNIKSREEYENITRMQKGSKERRKFGCCPKAPKQDLRNKNRYSMALIEKTDGAATEYFARLHKWSEEKRAQVEAIPNYLRLACRPCRHDYGVSLFLTGEYPVETLDDVLHGEKTFKYRAQEHACFRPSFYSGGAFDSTLVRHKARNVHQACSVLLAQSKAERIRYILKNGTEDGYQQRFVFSMQRGSPRRDVTRKDVFERAAKMMLPGSGRPPVGLNPERFIGQCEKCNAWLHGLEFGTTRCEQCEDRKPAAI